MKRAISRLTGPVTVHLTEPERDPIVIVPDQSVDLDQVVGQLAAVRDGAGAIVQPARPLTLAEALGKDLVAHFDLERAARPSPPMTPSRHVPVTGPKAASAAPEPTQKKEK